MISRNSRTSAAAIPALITAAAMVISACSGGGASYADPADFALAEESSFDLTPLDERAPIPLDAIAPYYVGSPQDPAAIDELLAQAERLADDGLVVAADVGGCILIAMWAQPQPDRVLVGYEFDTRITCAQAISYRAIFVIPDSGTNEQGSWDYAGVPPGVVTEAQLP